MQELLIQMSTDKQSLSDVHGLVMHHAAVRKLQVGVPIWRRERIIPPYIDKAYRELYAKEQTELKQGPERKKIILIQKRIICAKRREKGRAVYREAMIGNDRGAQMYSTSSNCTSSLYNSTQ